MDSTRTARLEPTSHVWQDDDVRLHYYRWPPEDEPHGNTDAQADAPIIIALHGWLDNGATFHNIAPALAHECLAIDLPGHGASQHLPPSADYAIWQSLSLLHRFILAHNHSSPSSRVILLGHSMGAAISMMYAAAFEEHVHALINIDGAGPLSGAPDHSLSQLRSALEADVTTSRPARVFADVDQAIRARQAANPYVSAHAIAPVVKHNLKEHADGWVWRTDPRLRKPSKVKLPEAYVQNILAGIRAPTLMLQARDSLVPDDLWQMRLSYIPHAQHIRLEGHHHLHLEPDTHVGVSQAITHFLETL